MSMVSANDLIDTDGPPRDCGVCSAPGRARPRNTSNWSALLRKRCQLVELPARRIGGSRATTGPRLLMPSTCSRRSTRSVVLGAVSLLPLLSGTDGRRSAASPTAVGCGSAWTAERCLIAASETVRPSSISLPAAATWSGSMQFAPTFFSWRSGRTLRGAPRSPGAA
jgi:hypothetical protein